MGTPDFAVYTLDALINAEHETAAVFTQPDKPRGRGKKVAFSPVKTAALQYSENIPVIQPTTLKTAEMTDIIRGYNPDCIVVAAYGMILPHEILNLPKYGCINVHASLLPKYRGAAPINRCIMDGETQSGVTIMQMDKGLDTGDILTQETVAIGENMNASELHDILAKTGAELLVKTLANIDNIKPVKQDYITETTGTAASYAAMLKKEECEIDFSQSAKTIRDFIRGLADYPCAYTFTDITDGANNAHKKRIKVYKAEIGQSDGVVINCGNGGGETITLTEVQPEGGKRMKAAEFIRGYCRS